MIDFIKSGTFPDIFPHARRLLRLAVIEDTMDVFEDHESLVRELPALAEAVRFMRQQHNSQLSVQGFSPVSFNASWASQADECSLSFTSLRPLLIN